MAFFNWNDTYCVGIAKIDTQHRRIAAYLNDLYQSMREGKGKDALNTILDGLIQYTKALSLF